MKIKKKVFAIVFGLLFLSQSFCFAELITGLSSSRKVVTTAGTAVQLTTASTNLVKVEITAETDNTGVIVVGGSGVIAAQATRTGIVLYPGDTWWGAVTDASKVYLNSTVNGDGVTYNFYDYTG